MGRHRKYFTEDEKVAANRAKSKRHYEKSKKEINRVRRKIHRREMKKRRSEVSSSSRTLPPRTTKSKQPKEVWLDQVHRVRRRYLAHIGGDAFAYMESLCTNFMETESIDDLRDQTTTLSNFQGALYHYQSEILQLEGLGDSWVKADHIVKEICITLSWVEEVYCAALIESQEVQNEYSKRRFLYQSAN